MSNNRMYLVNTRTGARICLAKYYPSTGWYTGDADLAAKMNMAFDEADFGHLTPEQTQENSIHLGLGVPHKAAGGMYGAEWVIEYEETEK